MTSFRQSPGRKVPTPNSREMVRFLGKVVQGHHYSLLTPRGLDIFRNRKNPGPEAAGLQLLILGARSDLCYRVHLDCPLKAPVQKAGPQSAVTVRWWEPLIYHWERTFDGDCGALVFSPLVFTSCP